MPLHRSRQNRMIAGVCGGVAEFFGWSPTLVRVLWVLLTPTTLFAGFLIYLILWVVMPESG
ncbi:MAG TPA: PspC domain-containing protein [Thermoanaerobaculia bacterium]|nr:PspC domain-containing protein [Thermoanaerobaculia bacterium]